jgi:hypothetical protein
MGGIGGKASTERQRAKRRAFWWESAEFLEADVVPGNYVITL